MSSDAIIASCLLHANTLPDCVHGSLVVAAYVGCFCQYIPLGEKTNQMVWEHKEAFLGIVICKELGRK